MIIQLGNTTIPKVASELVRVRTSGGVTALGRVLSLLVVTRAGDEEDAITEANAASHEHPMRVIVLMTDEQAPSGLSAEIRVGGDAGASEVIVLRASGEVTDNLQSLVTGLLLPDAPVAVWWHRGAPPSLADSSLGRMADRRISDAAAEGNPIENLRRAASCYEPGDTDLAWTRLTRWREQLAAALDDPMLGEVQRARVTGTLTTPSVAMMAAWLRLMLKVPVELVEEPAAAWGSGLHSVTLHCVGGNASLERTDELHATLVGPRSRPRHLVLPRRALRECLGEELRRISEDRVFGDVLTTALPGVLEDLNLA